MVIDLAHDCSCGYPTRDFDAHCRGRYYGDGAATAGILRDEGFDSLMARVKNGKRDARYAWKRGAFTERFDWVSWVPDIHEINHSKAVRCGGPMRGAYNDSLEQMIAEYGYTGEKHEPRDPACPLHGRYDFGVFVPEPGNVSAEKKLVGYVGLLRLGNTASYTTILGHGDYLQHGVMFALHFDVMRWAFSAPQMDGVFVVYYLGFYPPSLAVWKRKAGFQELMLS